MNIAEGAVTGDPCSSRKLSTPGSGRLPAPIESYCHACGTWDLHMSICSCCGVDFDAPTPSDHEA